MNELINQYCKFNLEGKIKLYVTYLRYSCFIDQFKIVTAHSRLFPKPEKKLNERSWSVHIKPCHKISPGTWPQGLGAALDEHQINRSSVGNIH